MISRRDFLKLTAFSTGTLAFRPLTKLALSEFPRGQTDKLGRIAVGKMDLYSRPDGSSQTAGALYEDNIHRALGPRSSRFNARAYQSAVCRNTKWFSLGWLCPAGMEQAQYVSNRAAYDQPGIGNVGRGNGSICGFDCG